jgi:hypothetical protein
MPPDTITSTPQSPNANGQLYFIDARLLRVHLRNIAHYAAMGSDDAATSIYCCQTIKSLTVHAMAIVEDAIDPDAYFDPTNVRPCRHCGCRFSDPFDTEVICPECKANPEPDAFDDAARARRNELRP